MRSLYILAGLLSLALFANCINARKGVFEDEPMPKLVQVLVHVTKGTSVSNKKSGCHGSAQPSSFEVKPKYNQLFTNDFDSRSTASVYVDNTKPKNESSFVQDFEPRPSMTAYVDNIKPKDGNSFVKDFEPRPSMTAYVGNIKPKDGNSFVKEFEPRPSMTAYVDNIKPN